jgi:hypothetical protein
MVPSPKDDPVRATLLAILRLLNQADVTNEGKEEEQAQELAELEKRLTDFGPIREGSVKVALGLGLLIRNGLVTAQTAGDYSWSRQREAQVRYRITAEGKKFLVGSVETSDRIPDASGRNSAGRF